MSLKDKIMKLQTYKMFANENTVYVERDDILKLLEQELRWIPVSERLPNFNDIVLASTDSDYDELRVILIVYECEQFWFNGKVKAWMPLPEPYEPQESEDKE